MCALQVLLLLLLLLLKNGQISVSCQCHHFFTHYYQKEHLFVFRYNLFHIMSEKVAAGYKQFPKISEITKLRA